MKVKSPFYIVQDFLSPLACERIVDTLDFISPDFDVNTKETLKSIKRNDACEGLIFERLEGLIPLLHQHYVGFDYKGTEVMTFEWYPPGSVNEVHCENSTFTKAKKWLRNRDRDLSMVLFLSDYQETIPFDNDFEVKGGKLEFPQHNFGFNPQRGTLIVFPSSPHFINATARIEIGELHQVRFHVAGTLPYLYDPTQFPGDFTSWFTHLN